MEPFQNSLPNLEVDWSCEVVKSFDQIYGRPYYGTLGTWWKVFISFLNSQNWSLAISYSVVCRVLARYMSFFGCLLKSGGWNLGL